MYLPLDTCFSSSAGIMFLDRKLAEVGKVLLVNFYCYRLVDLVLYVYIKF